MTFGRDFAFVGNQYKLEVFGVEHFPDLIFFNYYSFDGENKEIVTHDIFSNDKECVVTKENVYDKYFKSQDIVSMCCKIYKKKCIDLTNDYKKFGKFGTGEDTLQTIELINNARTFVYLNEPLYLYRMGTGMTRRFDENYYFSFKLPFSLDFTRFAAIVQQASNSKKG